MATSYQSITWTEPLDEVVVTHYVKPDVAGKKENAPLGRTTFGSFRIQVLAEGGENNLHSHVTNDGFWYVLRGGVRFYTVDDEVVVELGEGETFVTPRGYKYWFEAIPGKEDLELMRFGASSVPVPVEAKSERVNHEELKPNQVNLLRQKDDLPFDLSK